MSVFTRFDFDNDVVENQRTKVSSGLFSGGSGTLTAFFTGSNLGDVTGSIILHNGNVDEMEALELLKVFPKYLLFVDF